MDKKYLIMSFGYGLLGLVLGIYMAASKNHTQLVTHAHIMLLGFVVSFIYAGCYKMWVVDIQLRLAKVQYYCHAVGSLILLVGLFLMYQQWAAEKVLGPVLGVSSIVVFIAMVLMKIQLIQEFKANK
ncbi:TonB-dependent receptor [Gilvimarinus sp. SDUM040013]|uniref:TonB-dependent receptor n=1 Tax=Gilvimarinus gilvus TaxID=3058038 RepID=A0ABU4S3C3_9GAMM|nr:TonB-dependent receptor [Gilvimarinus sp. SDUM040013]MDO3386121.1 TonB-dependent receptor [Gilvimarinus sp. SDUM040013]MDX6850338.1 TonB-dependent receptor [Gilvimarinus sp. SDUM040013]